MKENQRLSPRYPRITILRKHEVKVTTGRPTTHITENTTKTVSKLEPLRHHKDNEDRSTNYNLTTTKQNEDRDQKYNPTTIKVAPKPNPTTIKVGRRPPHTL